MKKIITAAAIAAMAASFATAEVKVAVSYRTGIQALEHELGSNTTVFNNFTKNRTTSDALTFKGSAEYGGVELEIDPTVGDKSSKEGDVVGASKGMNFTDDNKYLDLVKYNGWINFGNLMLKSGTWDARAVGRVNGDEGNHEGKFWGEINKPGLAVAGGTAGNGKDVSQQSNKKQTTMVQYKNKDLGLEARFAYTDSDGTKTTFAGNDDKHHHNDYDKNGKLQQSKYNNDWVAANELWFGEVGYTVDGVGRVLATTKLAHHDYTGALFFEPKLANLSALTSLVGFTYETATDKAYGKGLHGKYYDSDLSESANTMAIDLRARYDLGAVVEGLSVTFMYNWTFGNTVKSKIATDRFGDAYIKDWKGLTYYDDAAKPGFYATWAMFNVTYKLNDTFTPFLSLGLSNGKTAGSAGTAAAFDDKFTCSLRTYAGVEIYNTKNANLITGVCWDVNNMNDGSGNHRHVGKDGKVTDTRNACSKSISIPVLLRVKF